MANKALNLIYAVKDGVPINIADVESGLKCGCTCPACGERLIAKKGVKMVHHFAHHSGHSCEYGYESALHLAAKEILSKAKRITIPAVYFSFPDSYKKKELFCEAQEIELERVELEKRFDNIIPDVVIYAGGKRLYLEIFVTHPVDENKLDKIKHMDVSTIEIDLSKKEKTLSYDELSKIILGNSEEKTWKYNSIENKLLQRFYRVANKRDFVYRGFTPQIDYCPIAKRSWRGKPYANFIDDCLYCKYCISSQEGDGMLCSGSARISSIKDFDIPEDIRLKSSNDEIQKEKESSFVAGVCPNCGSRLVERQSQYGTFWGCYSYPHCRFMATIDPDTGEINTKA